jgi:SAM-dependent methyltransferase
MAIIDEERNANLYSAEAYVRNTDNWEDAAAIFRAKALVDALRAGGIYERVSSILDVGCGSGGVLASFRDLHKSQDTNSRDVRLHGIDISAHAIQTARKLHSVGGESDLNFEVHSIADMDSSDKHTLVTLIHVLEHCPDALEMLKACETFGEFLYVNVPLEVNLFYSVRPRLLMNQYLKYGHVHFFNRSFFLTWLEKNGYRIISEVYSADFEVAKEGLFYNSMKLARRLLGYVSPSATAWLLGGFSLGVLIEKKKPG